MIPGKALSVSYVMTMLRGRIAPYRQNGQGWLALCLGAFFVSCGVAAKEEPMTLRLTSTAFENGASIPAKHTCEGQDLSPPLAWSDPPDGAKSFALIVDDPDAPDPKAPKMTWVHWVLYNLPPDSSGLEEGIKTAALPHGAGVGLNDWKRADYGGPCPPIGRHRYFHKLYALDAMLSMQGHPTKPEIEKAMQGHVLAEATLMGAYEKAH